MRDPATLPHYPRVIMMWQRGLNTADIAERLALPEHIVARCIAKYTDTKWRAVRLSRNARVDRAIQAGAYDA